MCAGMADAGLVRWTGVLGGGATLQIRRDTMQRATEQDPRVVVHFHLPGAVSFRRVRNTRGFLLTMRHRLSTVNPVERLVATSPGQHIVHLLCRGGLPRSRHAECFFLPRAGHSEAGVAPRVSWHNDGLDIPARCPYCRTTHGQRQTRCSLENELCSCMSRTSTKGAAEATTTMNGNHSTIIEALGGEWEQLPASKASRIFHGSCIIAD